MESRNEIAKQLHTLRDYLRWAVSQFTRAKLAYGHGTDNAYDEALHLLCHALTLPLEGDARLLDAQLTMEERHLVLVLLETRIKERIPVPYLTGEAWFAGLPFKVDERVLIPRSPIAEMIELGFQPWLGETEPEHILDLCTGSGCIGIACALAFPGAEVVLSDISEDALAIARQNMQRHGVEERVQALRADVFAGLDGGFDLIVSNPPYVDAEDLGAMPPEYQHEPRSALAAGEDGLDLVRRILRDAPARLNEGGLLVVEVGNSAAALERAYPELPFTWVEFERGGHGVFVLSQAELAAHRDALI